MQSKVECFYCVVCVLNLMIFLFVQGPEIRTGFLKDGKPVKLTQGKEITITTDYSIKGDENMISMSYQKIAVDLKPGSTILCADGTITLTVLSCDPAQGLVRCRCENSALLGERKKRQPSWGHCGSSNIDRKRQRGYLEVGCAK